MQSIVVGFSAGLLAISAQHPVHAQDSNSASLDARTILLKSLRTYYRMSSYNGRANADTLVLTTDGKTLRQIGTAVEIKYKRPNKLRIDFTTPIGSRIVWSNAIDLGVYDPLSRKFWIVPSAPNMDTMLPLLEKTAQIGTLFDPLYGLSRQTLPSQLNGFILKKKSTFNGHPVYVVSANLKASPSSEWTWWIDVNTSLILKVEQLQRNIVQEIPYVEDGKQLTKNITINLMMRSVISDARPNAQIADGDFSFKPPAGATPRISQGGTGAAAR